MIQEIKVVPYRNSLEPIINNKPTTIKLFEDRLEYFIHYKYKSKIQLEVPLITGEEEVEDSFVIYDKGFILKDSISSMSVFIEDYGDPTLEGNNELAWIIGIISSNQLNIRVQDKKEANRVYKELYNWKLNIKIENE